MKIRLTAVLSLLWLASSAFGQVGGGAGAGTTAGQISNTGQVAGAINRGGLVGGANASAGGVGGIGGGNRIGGGGIGGIGGIGGVGGLGGFGGGFGGGGFGGGGFGGGGRGGFGNQFGGNQQSNQGATLRVPMRIGFAHRKGPSAKTVRAFVARLPKIPGFAKIGKINARIDKETLVLIGTVKSAGNKDLAERLALLEPGIYKVRNELVVANAADSPER